MIHVYKSLGTHLDFGVGGEKTQIYFLLGGKSRQREFSMVSVAHNKTRLITSIVFPGPLPALSTCRLQDAMLLFLPNLRLLLKFSLM